MTDRTAAPGFWTVVFLLLGAARRRGAGRVRRRLELQRKRGGFAAPPFLALAIAVAFALVLNVGVAVEVAIAVSTAAHVQAVANLPRQATLPDIVAFILVAWWCLMMICQGEEPQLDTQRPRNPVWEWLFSHPASSAAIFFAEMIAPIAVNPVYLTAPLFPGVLYGIAYGWPAGIAAALLVGVPVAVALAC